jgi:hypothetical protein
MITFSQQKDVWCFKYTEQARLGLHTPFTSWYFAFQIIHQIVNAQIVITDKSRNGN